MTSACAVIFGAGAIGRTLAELLAERDELPIRLVSRSGANDLPDGIEVVRGDASDRVFTTAAAAGAEVVYQVLNPPYHRWAQDFPPLQAAVLVAAEAAGARMVSMDNVYNYGPADGRPFTEDRADAAHTRKGTIRARMAADLLDAHRAGRVAVSIGRASDYYGPRGGHQSNLGDRVFGAILAGKTASVLGDPDQPHTYSYIPDIAAGLAALGAHEDSAGEVWHLPNDPDTRTTRDLVEQVYRDAGRSRGKVRAAPWPMLRVAGLVNPTLRELVEMRYEYDEPFVVDSTKITQRYGLRATPYADGIAQTLATYRSAVDRP